MPRALAGILRVVNVLVTNQLRLDHNNNDEGKASMAQGTNGSAGGALLKEFHSIATI